MATRRAIKGVLGNFLGTFTSRYSDFGGYWIFGFLVDELAELRIDLLESTDNESNSPIDVAVRLAIVKFTDQVRKAGVNCSQIREAWLTVTRLPRSVEGVVNGHLCAGYNFIFAAGAAMDGGRLFRREQIVFVVPHDARFELRSVRVV